MDNSSAPQWQNIAFTAVVAVACVLIYLLVGKSGGEREAPSPAAAQETAVSSPAPETTPEEAKPAFAVTPAYLFTELLVAQDAFSAAPDKKMPRAYHLVYQSQVSGTGELSYTISDDGEFLTSLTLVFPCRDKPPSKPKSAIERSLADSYNSHIALQNQAIKTMLLSVVNAADVNGSILEPVLLEWYAAALRARDDEKIYTDTQAGCTFTAYPSMEGTSNVVVCSLYFP